MFQSVYEFALGLTASPDCAKVSDYVGDYFGVFVGVTRSAAHAVKEWPQNIHGSIGYWDRDFKKVEPAALCKHTHRVALDAVSNDDRKQYFPDLLTDVDAVLDVKFMCLPIRDIDAQSGLFTDDGSPFSNDAWGLLVQKDTGGGATFLPGVFKQASWASIKQRVLSKAGFDLPARFYAYRTHRSAAPLCRIYSRTQPFKLLTKIGCCFIKFVNGCERVPYGVTQQQRVVYDDTQDVRNIATLLDLRRLSTALPCSAKNFSADTTHYVRQYIQEPASMQQASAFLLPLLEELKMLPELQKVIARRLERNLLTMEPAFQLGESLVALKKKMPMRRAQSVFELNWQAQAWPQNFMRQQLHAYVKQFNQETETNYVAVAFEAACNLRMRKLAHALFCKLMQRYDASRGLFKFLDGSSRVDIACHVHGGFLAL